MPCLSMPPQLPPQRKHPGISYTLLESLLPWRARFTFTGPFQGSIVLWNATLLTVDHASASAAKTVSSIEVGEMTTAGRDLIVTLDIPAVDEAEILRTIIMIRQYRRLRPGHHAFGEKAGF